MRRYLYLSFARAAKTFAAIVFSTVSLWALQPAQHVTQYGHAAWTRQDGSLPGVVNAITQTLDGSLWAGTEFGLFRFDGMKFTSWTPPSGEQLAERTVTALAAAPDGGLWIGTRKGLSYWKGRQLKQYARTAGTNGPGVSSVIVDRKGTVWVGTVGFNSGQLCQLRADKLSCSSPADGYDGRGVLTLFEDRAGGLWVGGIGGLYRRDARGFRYYAGTSRVQAIAQAADGDPILPSADGLSKLAQDRLMDYSAGSAIRNAHTRVLLSDRDGGLWVGTIGKGLLHLYQGRVDGFTRADGLSGDNVLSLFEDREGNIWVGTDRGLDRFRDLPVTTLSSREGLSADTVVSVFASKRGGVWLGTTDGLNHVAAGRIDAGAPGLPSRSIGSIFEDGSGTLWADTPLGLGFREPDSVQWRGLSGGGQAGFIAAMAEDRHGALWFSDERRGLIRVEGHRVTKVIPWSQFDSKFGSALDVDPVSGRLLIGFAQGGLAEFGDDRVIRWYRSSGGVGAVTDLHFDAEGTAWIATEDGLSRLKDGGIAAVALSGGPGCAEIHSMAEDDDRGLWLDTRCGLLHIPRPELDAWSANPRIAIKPVVYGIRDGMQVRAKKGGYFRGAAKSKDGRLWFAELDGVAVVDPRHLPENRLPPPVAIESIEADQKARAIRPGLKLPHISHGLEIDYTAFSFVDPGRVRFKYRLAGYDSQWVDAGERRQAFYPGLPPANYRFRVIASNNDGVWNNTGASLDFNVAPTYYQTVWFRLAGAILIAGFGWLAYSLRLRRLEAKLNLRFEERMRERMRIARDLHDTLLQNISGFALHLDGLSRIVTAPPSAGDQLRELRRQAESWLSETRESVWDLRLEPAGEDDLAAAIGRAGSRITQRKGIAFHVRTSGERRVLKSRTQQSLLGIVQEAVRNAAAHSNAREIDVHLSYPDADRICIEIRDDGQGFDLDAASRRPRHWGLATMRERAEEIGASFHIDASPGQGVRIGIRCPLSPPDGGKND